MSSQLPFTAQLCGVVAVAIQIFIIARFAPDTSLWVAGPLTVVVYCVAAIAAAEVMEKLK